MTASHPTKTYERLLPSPYNDKDPEDETDEALLPCQSQESIKRPQHLKLTRNILVLIFAAFGFVMLIYQVCILTINSFPHSSIPGTKIPHSCDCGDSTAEALTLGCKYDSLAAAWLPPHCRDDALTAEFEKAGPGPDGSWTYYADANQTQVLTLPEVAALADHPGQKFYMSGHWHVVHCMYYWRKQLRSLTGQGNYIVEPRSESEGHIMHCLEVVTSLGKSTVAGVALNTDEL